MENICPYCNGFETLSICCPACGRVMEDIGTLQDSLGPYSPHEENSLVHAQYGCVHQVFCQNCQQEYFYSVTSPSGSPPMPDHGIEDGDNQQC
ncbi:MAG: hypothetical protein KGZ79_06045 [Dethiobacter sp.]|nr:hypothetical protein [Dethiobacter sp.]